MSAYLLDWVNLLGRWVHMITGIAWIGASFYFIWLDNSLEPPKSEADRDKGVSGEVWSVHGGGMYHAQKYQVAAEKLPETLHWFKWEAYTTWISGMFMLALMYWYSAEIYLIDPAVANLSKPVAVLIGAALIVVGWFAYDRLCKSAIGNRENLMAAVLFVALSIIAYLLCQLFSGRGAYMHFGAMLGTIMVGNVFFVIIPGQKDMVRSIQQGSEPDPIHGIRGKQRSVHNTYFTLPVLFVMVSNHYAMTYGHELNWLILIAITMIGALVRVYFVARHKGRASPVPLLLSLAVLAAIVTLVAPRQAQLAANAPAEVNLAQVQQIVTQRCSTCHATMPSQPGFQVAPQGIVFDSAEDILRQAAAVHQQTVVTRAMPIGNLTGITDDERTAIDVWFRGLEK
jgi:uncharacterized membrane protein